MSACEGDAALGQPFGFSRLAQEQPRHCRVIQPMDQSQRMRDLFRPCEPLLYAAPCMAWSTGQAGSQAGIEERNHHRVSRKREEQPLVLLGIEERHCVVVMRLGGAERPAEEFG